MTGRAKPNRGLRDLPIPLDTAPMEARLVTALPSGPEWLFEPKWDGFRCLAFRAGDEVELKAKSGKPLTRFFPEVADRLRKLDALQFVIDGELVIPTGETLSFDALQMRLHPAESRITKLARETPALFVLFDCLLSASGENLMGETLTRRRAVLEEFVKQNGADGIALSQSSRDRSEARRWLDQGGEGVDGVIAKRRDGLYRPGERDMLKVKLLRSADCVVGGFRYASQEKLVGSLLLGLYNDNGELDHVGFTSGFAGTDRAALTKRLEKLIEPPGFTGNAPGGPSRWSTERSAEWQPLKPELVVEVRYDKVTAGRFRHGTKLLRWRPDKAPRQCTHEQIEPPQSIELLETLLK